MAICAACGNENPDGAKFCNECGAALRLLAAAPALEERKVVSVLFCDLVGFTAASERQDPEDVRARIRPYHARLKREIERYGGTVEKFVGDAVMAVFGAPAAHEDDAERAVRVGLRILQAIGELNEADPWLGLQVRIGINTGEVVVALGARPEQGEGIVTGDVVNTAARIQGVAPVDGMAVSEPTYRATSRLFDYEPLAPISVKGKAEPLVLWRATASRARFGADIIRRYETPFVGRELERALLIGTFERAAQQGSVQRVTVIGEPGVGKSRLIGELLSYVDAKPDVTRWRQGRCLPYGEGIAFWALGEIVKAEAGILESDSAEVAADKLERIVSPDELERPWLIERLAPLVGVEVPSPAERQELFTAWRRFLEGLATPNPTVLVFEDLHWADQSLLAFLEYLAEWSQGVPLLIVCAARRELYERRPEWGDGQRNAQTIDLSPLSEEETAELVSHLTRTAVLGPALGRAIVERAEGNPLYAEEFVRLVADRRLEHADGPLEPTLPDSVHALIAARLDTLSPDRKALLQDAAVVGKVFWVGALHEIGGRDPEDTEVALHELVRRELVRPVRTSSMEDEREYSFWHQLVRDVAYSQIPRSERVRRHQVAAAWIERKGGERVEDFAEVLAHHYLQALELAAALEGARTAGGDVAMLVERGEQALHRAGLRAIRLSANERAVEYFSHAIALAGRLPEGDERRRTEAELQLQLGVALFALRGLGAPEVEQAYTRATELMMASAPAAEQFLAQFGLSIYHGHRGHFHRSLRLVERLTELAAKGDDSMRLQALHARWMNSLFAGRINDAIAAANEARAIYRPQAHHPLSFRYGNHDPGVCALALQALAFALRGESVKAVTQMHEAVALGETLGHAATLAQPLTQLPWALQINGDAEGALRESERALAREDEVVHPQFFGIARAMRGWALSRTAREKEGVAELERALAEELQASDIWAAMIGAILAEVHLRRGRPEATRAVLDQMRSLTQSMPSYFYEPEFLRVEAEWLRMHGREDDARRLLLLAISTAREHGSWALAIRSALVLARAPSAAHEADLGLLADVCERLPSDNDTDYGREARGVLAETVAMRFPDKIPPWSLNER